MSPSDVRRSLVLGLRIVRGVTVVGAFCGLLGSALAYVLYGFHGDTAAAISLLLFFSLVFCALNVLAKRLMAKLNGEAA